MTEACLHGCTLAILMFDMKGNSSNVTVLSL